MTEKVRTILYGFGPLGQNVAKFILEKGYIDIVGAIDLANVGKDLGEVVGLERKTGVAVTDDANDLFANVEADIVIHMTASSLEKIFPQLTLCANAGLNVITSCEELSYPFFKQEKLAGELHKVFQKRGVTVMGTGINPGFLMDKFPLLISGICLDVQRVKVTRMMYSRVRRPSFQKKIGTGMEKDEFLRLIDEKVITGHVGLVESAAMIVGGLGWDVDDIQELPVEPVMCESEVTTFTDPSEKEVLMTVKPGQVAGLRSVAEARKNGEVVVSLDFVAHANVDEPYDSVEITGTPDLHVKFVGGMNGDMGTVAVLTNSIPRILNAAPGLLNMMDMNMPVPFTDKTARSLIS